MSNNTLTRRSWGYPDCPNCGTDVFVGGNKKSEDYRCHWCNGEWS